uniref:Uncharacterized protein n=1 Tax=Oryza nivara TaxID=4536 RepID=A0A0E0J4F0_ORYNI
MAFPRPQVSQSSQPSRQPSRKANPSPHLLSSSRLALGSPQHADAAAPPHPACPRFLGISAAQGRKGAAHPCHSGANRWKEAARIGGVSRQRRAHWRRAGDGPTAAG